MGPTFNVTLKWAPRNPLGQFEGFLTKDPAIRLGRMTVLQERIAQIAAEGAPMGLSGNLKREMFVGGGGNSIVTPGLATVEPGDPYGPQINSGFSGNIDPDRGKYYSLLAWVQERLGGDEHDAFMIAQNMNYEGVNYMEGAAAMAPIIMEEEGTKLTKEIYITLGF
jgi:hypothetical protein